MKLKRNAFSLSVEVETESRNIVGGKVVCFETDLKTCIDFLWIIKCKGVYKMRLKARFILEHSLLQKRFCKLKSKSIGNRWFPFSESSKSMNTVEFMSNFRTEPLWMLG